MKECKIWSLANFLLASLSLGVFTWSFDFSVFSGAAMVVKMEPGVVMQPAWSRVCRLYRLHVGELLSSLLLFLNKRMFNCCFLSSRILLCHSQIMPHLVRKMNYFRKFVQKEAKSFATVKYYIQICESSLLQLGWKYDVELGQLGNVSLASRNTNRTWGTWPNQCLCFSSKKRLAWRYMVKGWWDGFTNITWDPGSFCLLLFYCGVWPSLSWSQGVCSTLTSGLLHSG